MNLFQYVLSSVYNLFCMEFTLYGYTFSFLDVTIWGCVASSAIYFIGRLLNGD